MIDTDRTGGQAAARLLATSVIRMRPSPRPPHDRTADGWYGSPEQCANALADLLPTGVVRSWFGFGGPWPVIQLGRLLVAPGLPAAVGPGGFDGPDGHYHASSETVWRDAAGVLRPVLSAAAGPHEPPCDLLWFGDGERFTVRAGRIEVEDRVCRLSLPATPDRLERLLVRQRRLDRAVLEDLPEADPKPPTLEVCRAAALVGPTWRDPAAVVRARIGVAAAALTGDHLAVTLEDGARQSFVVETTASGWRAERHGGAGPLAAIGLSLSGDEVLARAELDPGLDPLAPGVRGRVAFDLASDLVVLGRSG